MNGSPESPMCEGAPTVNPIILIETKKCVKCGATDWYKSGECRPCKRTRGAKYYAENTEKVNAAHAKYRAETGYSAKHYSEHTEKALAYAAKYRAENAEQIRARSAKFYAENVGYREKYRAEHPEQARASSAKYRAEHPEVDRAHYCKRRAQKREAGGLFTAQDIKDMLKRQKNKCVVCRTNISNDYHIDHIMPLSLGGHNGITNIQLLCPPCNRSKHTKHPVDFMQSRGYLL